MRGKLSVEALAKTNNRLLPILHDDHEESTEIFKFAKPQKRLLLHD